MLNRVDLFDKIHSSWRAIGLEGLARWETLKGGGKFEEGGFIVGSKGNRDGLAGVG